MNIESSLKYPILSIIIPTKDRYITLMKVLSNLIVEIHAENIEIIVQDNTENNSEFLKFINGIHDPRVKYFHSPVKISVTENCDKAIINSTGKYVIMIGDDDFVLDNISNAVTWMESNNVQCLNSNTATYYWPNLTFKTRTRISNPSTLLLKKPIKNSYRKVDAIKELRKVIKSGGITMANLPRLYHGIVLRSVLEQVFQSFNTYFPGPSPDMANSVALSLYVKSFQIFNYPFSISGKSVSSAAGLGLNHKHVGNLEEKTFLNNVFLRKWDAKIPFFWTGDTIYAQSLSNCLTDFNYKFSINYNKLYSHLLIYEFTYSKEITSFIVKTIRSYPLNILPIFYWTFIFLIYRILNYLVRLLYPSVIYKIYKNVSDISQSSKILS